MTTERSFIYISLFVHNLISKAICSDSTNFCLQIFVYNCVFWKKEKQHSQNLSNTYLKWPCATFIFCQFLWPRVHKKIFRKTFTFWKWKHISKKNHILKMKAHSETHFETTLINVWWVKWLDLTEHGRTHCESIIIAHSHLMVFSKIGSRIF